MGYGDTIHKPESSEGLHKLRAILGQLDQSAMSTLPMGVAACGKRQNLTNFIIPHPSLFIPVHGGKTVRFGLSRYSAEAGQVLMVPGNVPLTITNRPDRSDSGFLGVCIPFDSDTVEHFHWMFGRTLKPSFLAPAWKSEAWEELYWTVAQWIEHSMRFRADVNHLRHKLVECLYMLSRKGVAGNILNSPQQTLGDRIRSNLALDPSRNWRASEVASELGMSESTLRRRLRKEKVSFRSILEFARMDHGIDLVLFSKMPIVQVADACGYQSQSRFAERFKRRFSMSPTELRSTEKYPRDQPQTTLQMGVVLEAFEGSDVSRRAS